MGAKPVSAPQIRVDTPYADITDRRFVLDNINALMDLPQPLTEADIIAERCGVRPLAVQGDGGEADWLALSRKHAIDVNTAALHEHIRRQAYGLFKCRRGSGSRLEQCGIALPHAQQRWYGEPDAVRDEFFHQAELMQLDAMTDERASELSRRLWRRYGLNAIELLDQIRQDPRQAEILIQHLNTYAVNCTMWREKKWSQSSNFLRRRSKISCCAARDN